MKINHPERVSLTTEEYILLNDAIRLLDNICNKATNHKICHSAYEASELITELFDYCEQTGDETEDDGLDES